MLKDLFGLLSVIVILVSIVIYFSVQSLVTYASVGLLAGMVCLLIYIAVNFDRLSMFFRRQSTKYGLNLLVTVVVLLVIIGIVEVLSARKNIRYDLTAEKTLTLAPLSKQVLEGLEKDVTVTVFYQRDQVFEFRDLLQQFKEETDRFSFQLFNLDQNPGGQKNMV
ncbi:MAG: Gldg family protein [Thermodesulfobacteriota bacterium]|nr:Gldg family protein [Thermodesulfobacteriota bacterium]